LAKSLGRRPFCGRIGFNDEIIVLMARGTMGQFGNTPIFPAMNSFIDGMISMG